MTLFDRSATYTKHDDYWRNDPKFPDNRLPYADQVECVFVNDPAAITSLMRSGQADWMGFAGLILGTYLAASTMRMTRTMMLEVLRQDYIRTAWAKGLRERLVILRHVIKNALIPVVTLVGLQVPIIVGGSVIMEQMFAIPGLGRLMIDAPFDRRLPADLGDQPVLRRRGDDDQPAGRRAVRLPGPARPLRVTGCRVRRC